MSIGAICCTPCAQGIAAGSPIRDAAFKYLDVVAGNPSWTFAKRLHMCNRLVEISAALGGQLAGGTVRGSPFASLFAKDGPPVAMKLARATPHALRQRDKQQMALLGAAARAAAAGGAPAAAQP